MAARLGPAPRPRPRRPRRRIRNGCPSAAHAGLRRAPPDDAAADAESYDWVVLPFSTPIARAAPREVVGAARNHTDERALHLHASPAWQQPKSAARSTLLVRWLRGRRERIAESF